MTNAELGKLVRNSARHNGRQSANVRNYNQQQQLAAATKNLYNKQQPLQYAPTQSNRRQYGSSDLSGYNPLGTAATNGQANANNDDDENEGGNFGANFDGGDNDGEGNQADGQPMNLNQAASGYPGQGDYSEGAGFNFGGAGGYGPSAGEGSDFGPSEGFGGDGRRAKAASSMRGVGDDDAGAPLYGPNSAVNSGDNDDEGRAGYAPEASNDGNDDDE